MIRTLVIATILCSAAYAGAVVEGRDELLYLDGLGAPARWGPSEATVTASKEKADGHPTVHLHIPVDHHGGEAKYPIGWPRMYLNLKPDERAWTDYERFEFLAYVVMTRPTPPRKPINLQIQCPDRERNNNLNLEQIRLGEWARISVPIREIKNVGDVARLGFNISESDYRHGETLDFRFGGFRLARSREFRFSLFRVGTRVAYQGTPTLGVMVDAVGPPGEIAKGAPLAIRQGERTLQELSLPVKHGMQTLRVPVAGLAPGRYSLVAFPGDEGRKVSEPFRVVESPWPAE